MSKELEAIIEKIYPKKARRTSSNANRDYMMIDVDDFEELEYLINQTLRLTPKITSDNEKRLIKLLLITLQAYQENFNNLLKEETLTILNYSTVQYSPNIMDIIKLSKMNIEDINSFNDLITFFIHESESE